MATVVIDSSHIKTPYSFKRKRDNLSSLSNCEQMQFLKELKTAK